MSRGKGCRTTLLLLASGLRGVAAASEDAKAAERGQQHEYRRRQGDHRRFGSDVEIEDNVVARSLENVAEREDQIGRGARPDDCFEVESIDSALAGCLRRTVERGRGAPRKVGKVEELFEA
jgi:hypothetical protein